MKHYTPTEIKAAVKQQNYKTAALENNKGERIQNFNSTKTSNINKHLDLIHKRLQSEIFDDGIYYILMATSIVNQKKPDRYPIIKGKFNQSMLNDNGQNAPIIVQSPTQEVLSWEAALSYQNKISELTSEVHRLKLELNNANTLLEEYEEEEEEKKGLSDTTTTGSLMEYLKEIVPSILPMADRYFDIEEKKLNLQRQRHTPKDKPQNIKPIITGSFQHLSLIEQYYNAGHDDKLSKELDKLEEFNTDLYKQVCAKFGIEIDETEEGTNG